VIGDLVLSAVALVAGLLALTTGSGGLWVVLGIALAGLGLWLAVETVAQRLRSRRGSR